MFYLRRTYTMVFKAKILQTYFSNNKREPQRNMLALWEIILALVSQMGISRLIFSSTPKHTCHFQKFKPIHVIAYKG
ncbi:hypothetical protein A4A49_30306 [Nicotiana attenuata]|uniref:Uncharacterized protein n=1 Tax=Nicotiana attenuata TaxID=49451 RepID=A0A1J6I2T1_NICAT|nr:hypothetical protein A4A49_30306 [Nicotiana attenuata]